MMCFPYHQSRPACRPSRRAHSTRLARGPHPDAMPCHVMPCSSTTTTAAANSAILVAPLGYRRVRPSRNWSFLCCADSVGRMRRFPAHFWLQRILRYSIVESAEAASVKLCNPGASHSTDRYIFAWLGSLLPRHARLPLPHRPSMPIFVATKSAMRSRTDVACQDGLQSRA
ncbi:hypothetical protein LZ30DRAFT_436069 [Colletotrichum cereale]|nr:hypothetical protein LZ30DRAFT_436069 [Colletotrichum cereale]